MELKTVATSPKAKKIIVKLNSRIRDIEDSMPFEQIRYSLAGWAESFATKLFNSTMRDIDPALAALLYKIKSQGGSLEVKMVVHRVHGEKLSGDAYDLIDYGIAALDLRAPEDREADKEFAEFWHVDGQSGERAGDST